MRLQKSCQAGIPMQINEIKADIEWLEGAIRKEKQKATDLKESVNLGERFNVRTFENFNAEAQPKAYGICKRYADRFFDIKDGEKNSLVLIGNCGTGKTHLVASITNQLVDNGIPVLFGTFAEHLDRIKAEFGSNGTYLEKMKSATLLVVDDYGKERNGEWNKEVWYTVLNARYERKLPTIITTNLSALEFAEYNGNAVQSRLAEMSVIVKVEGKDWRK